MSVLFDLEWREDGAKSGQEFGASSKATFPHHGAMWLLVPDYAERQVLRSCLQVVEEELLTRMRRCEFWSLIS